MPATKATKASTEAAKKTVKKVTASKATKTLKTTTKAAVKAKPAVKAKSTVKAKSAVKAKPVAKKKVKAIPNGCDAVTPYLIVHNATEALKFYKKAFGAKELMCFADPQSKKVMHAEIMIGNSMIMLSEECPEMKCFGPKTIGGSPVMLHHYVENVDAVFKKAVAAGATVLRPVADQFYGDRSGCLADPYGHLWGLATHIEDVSDKEVRKRFAEMKKSS